MSDRYDEYRKRMTEKRAAIFGWRKLQGGSKLLTVWGNDWGYVVRHCGHPTANMPWAAYTETGQALEVPQRFVQKAFEIADAHACKRLIDKADTTI